MRTVNTLATLLAILMILPLILSGVASTALASQASEAAYEPPPGVMPVVIISGTPYEMGYQYGQQVGDYIERVKEALWSSLLARYDKSFILSQLKKYEEHVKTLPGIDYVQIMKGIADGARDAGYDVTYEDVLAINFQVELEWVPAWSGYCTNIAVWGSATADGKTITGSNFDYPWGKAYSYRVIVVAYPSNANSFVSTAIAGMLGNNFAMNDKGLVVMSNKGPNVRPVDKGYGVSDFILEPYMAMMFSSAEEAKNFLLNVARTNGINHLVVDKDGNAYVVETTADLAAVRKAGDYGEKDYLIAANHWLIPDMKPSMQPWPGFKYYPSSWFRQETAKKYIEENYGKISVDTVKAIMASTDYWNGTQWFYDAEWTGNTINRFAAWGGTMASQIAVPEEKTVYICTGNPNIPYWGAGAPAQTGEYVKITLEKDPASLTSVASGTALLEMFTTAQAIDSLTNPADVTALNEQFNQVKQMYWRGLWYQAKAGLAQDINEALKLYAKATTCFIQAQAHCLQIKRQAETLGAIPSLKDIHASLTSIEKDVEAEVGKVKADIATVGEYVAKLTAPVYAALTFSVIAAAAAIYAVVLARRKA